MGATFNYRLFDGHILMEVGQQSMLIDTGAPCGFARASPIQLGNREYRFEKDFMGMSSESLSTNVGCEVHALIGADVLNHYDILIDPEAGCLTLSEDELPLEGQSIPVELYMGIPVLEAGIHGRPARMFFDTGAKLSYLDRELTSGCAVAGSAEDFYPTIGRFTTNVYEITVELAADTIKLQAGNLPELLQMTLMMANTRGILGTAILRTHRVTYSPRRRLLAINKMKP